MSNQSIKGLVKKLSFIWRKKYLQLFIVFALLGTIFLFYAYSKVNDYLIFYTLVVLFWYSKETMDLKRIANKELDRLRVEHKTNLRPYLRLQKGDRGGLILVNEGKGVAVNLRTIYKKDDATTKLLRIPAMAAAPGSSTQSFVPNNSGLELDPTVVSFTIDIAYNDIEKRNYLAVFKSNPLFNDGFEIVKQEEV